MFIKCVCHSASLMRWLRGRRKLLGEFHKHKVLTLKVVEAVYGADFHRGVHISVSASGWKIIIVVLVSLRRQRSHLLCWGCLKLFKSSW